MAKVDWKNQGFQIIASVIASGLLVSAFTIFYTDFYKKPNVHIDLLPNTNDNSNTTILVTNIGATPATDFALKILSARKIINYSYFSSENNTIKYSAKSIEMDLPRFSNGEGSIIQIEITTDTKLDNVNDNYEIYATFEQGSSKSINILDFSNYYFPLDVIISWIYNIFIMNNLPLPIVLLLGSSLIVFLVMFNHERKKRNKIKFIDVILAELYGVREQLQKNIQLDDNLLLVEIKFRRRRRLLFDLPMKAVAVLTNKEDQEIFSEGDIGEDGDSLQSFNKQDMGIGWNTKDYSERAKIFEREQFIHNKPIDKDKLMKINIECKRTGEKALKEVDWKKYRQ